MLIGICGDQHWTNTCPANRTDDYAEAVLRKFRWELDTLAMCDCICLPGDLFDSYKVPYGVCTEILKSIGKIIPSYSTGNIFCVYGQHDQRYHTLGTKNTPLGLMLEAVPTMHLLGKKPISYTEGSRTVDFYGASWGEEIPEIQDTGHFNVLVTHRMVIGDTKLWEEQTDYTEAKGLLVSTKYDLIITGDNHQRVIMQDVRKRAVVNLGSMMRSTTAQYGHKPAVAIYDTVKKDLSVIDIPVQPSEDVFAVDKVATEKERDEKLDLFINALQNPERQASFDYAANLASYVQKNREIITDDILYEINMMLPVETKLEV